MKSYYLGCDVSKGYADFIILDQSKHIFVSSFQLDDTRTGHKQMETVIRGFFKKRSDCVLFCGVESTGGYENNWYALLRRLGMEFPLRVTRLNPKGVKHHGKSSLQRVETDKTSARTIADYLITHYDVVRYDEEDQFSLLRRHFKFIVLLKKQKAQLLNQLESLLYSANPELLQYCRRTVPQWLLRLLEECPTAADICQASEQSLSTIPYLSDYRAGELISQATNSVASTQSPAMGTIIKGAVRQIQTLTENIKVHVSLIMEQCQLPEIELLKTIPGISDYSAICLYLEIGDVNRFPSAKKLACFFGIHPAFKESGDGKYEIKMSKQGRVRPRVILFMSVFNAIQQDSHLAAVYASYLQRGIAKMSAIGIMMHKLARIVYGVLKNKEAYDPEIDRNNQTAIRKTQHSPDEHKKERRYQGFDPTAPISRRHMKKRKEQKRPKTDNSSVHNGITSALLNDIDDDIDLSRITVTQIMNGEGQ
ncbi:IS110 family transposase [candidate division CSSED10-310 bacterium]|uniref:IS110 family transposase n=1 Tax=candidate division CSSED10-310 bacterium TaxID=2855610 RepID=A0ABV6Z5Q2_UNCC1